VARIKKNVNYVLRPWFAVQYLYNRLQWLARSTAVWEDQGSSLFADGCIHATAAALYTALGMGWTPYKQTRSTQPSTLRGTVKWLSAYALSNNNSGEVDVDGSCQFSSDSQPKLTGLVWGLAATRRSVCIRQVNWVNSCNYFGHDDSTINIVVVIAIITNCTPYVGVW